MTRSSHIKQRGAREHVEHHGGRRDGWDGRHASDECPSSGAMWRVTSATEWMAHLREQKVAGLCSLMPRSSVTACYTNALQWAQDKKNA